MHNQRTENIYKCVFFQWVYGGTEFLMQMIHQKCTFPIKRSPFSFRDKKLRICLNSFFTEVNRLWASRRICTIFFPSLYFFYKLFFRFPSINIAKRLHFFSNAFNTTGSPRNFSRGTKISQDFRASFFFRDFEDSIFYRFSLFRSFNSRFCKLLFPLRFDWLFTRNFR